MECHSSSGRPHMNCGVLSTSTRAAVRTSTSSQSTSTAPPMSVGVIRTSMSRRSSETDINATSHKRRDEWHEHKLSEGRDGRKSTSSIIDIFGGRELTGVFEK